MQEGIVAVAAFGTALLSACATLPSAAGQTSPSNSREEIFVLRSLREERSAKSEWCTSKRTGFEPSSGGFLVEDRYTMWAVATGSSDGRITDARTATVGTLHACFASTADPKVINFYADGRISGLVFEGSGNCLVVRTDFPENGITTVRCFLDIRGLPAPYVGGFLATNTVNSRATLGETTDPPGYVQASIATIRLWRSSQSGIQ